MKKFTLLIFSPLLMVFYGCVIPHNCCDVAHKWADITALRNGIAWNPQYVNGTMTDLDSLKIAALDGTVAGVNFVKTDTLNIKVSYIGTGNYKLTAKQVFYATYTNGVSTSYKMDTPYNNVLNITSYQSFENSGSTVPNDI